MPDHTISLAYGCQPRTEPPGGFRALWMARVANRLEDEGWGTVVMQSYADQDNIGKLAIGLSDTPNAPVLSFAWFAIEDALHIDDMIVETFRQYA